MLASQQITGGTTYQFPSYQYNLADGLTSIQYASKRVVQNTFDSAGRITAVQGTSNVVAATYYTSNSKAITYAAHGGMLAMTRGDSAVEQWAYNSRLQVQQIQVGTTANPTSVFGSQLYYCAGKVQGTSCTANNGNVMTQTLSVLGVDQNYLYL